MIYSTIKNDFLKEYPDYSSDIHNFTRYLETQWNGSLDDETFAVFFGGINVEFLMKSLIYFIKKGNFSSKSKAKRYSSALGQYFYFAGNYTNINKELYNSIASNRLRKDSYIQRMFTYIERCDQLAEITEQKALIKEEVEYILDWTNQQLDNPEWNDPTNFRKAMASLGIKLMLLYGITYRELRKLDWNHYDNKYGFITINGFSLRLPVNLSVQLKQLKDFIDNKKICNEQNTIFTDFYGKSWGNITSSSGIPDYLNVLLNTTSITCIVKYGISQLIKAGISDSIIKKLTGASDKLIHGCIMQKDEYLKNEINNKLVNVELYYRF